MFSSCLSIRNVSSTLIGRFIDATKRIQLIFTNEAVTIAYVQVKSARAGVPGLGVTIAQSIIQSIL